MERHKRPATEEGEIEIAASSVLDFLLDEHPDHLTLPELSLALRVNPREPDPEEDDEIERAIDELIANGLARISGGLLVPTRSALYLKRLREHL